MSDRDDVDVDNNDTTKKMKIENDIDVVSEKPNMLKLDQKKVDCFSTTG